MQNSQKNLHKKLLGRAGEELTCKYLKKHGYKIIERNYVTPFGEADIIALKDGVYHFVEVKTRATDTFALPTDAVDERKRERYRRIAWSYCNFKRMELPCRFDISSVVGEEIEYFEAAYV